MCRVFKTHNFSDVIAEETKPASDNTEPKSVAVFRLWRHDYHAE